MPIPLIDFEDEIKVRKITFYLLISIIIAILVLIFVIIFSGKMVFVRPAFTQEKMMKSDVCYYGFKSIADKKPVSELLSKESYEALIQSQFKIFDLGNVLAIGKPSIVGDKCFISAKDEKGILAFKIKLKEVQNNYGYIITDVEEVESLLYKDRE
jgi:hypothetical protein